MIKFNKKEIELYAETIAQRFRRDARGGGDYEYEITIEEEIPIKLLVTIFADYGNRVEVSHNVNGIDETESYCELSSITIKDIEVRICELSITDITNADELERAINRKVIH